MTKPKLYEMPIGAILNGPNVRVIEEDDELTELAHSLSRRGFLAPVGAVEDAEEVATLLYGFRRVGAYHLGLRLGLPMPELVPVLVYPATLSLLDREIIQCVENLQRVDLSEVERHKVVKSLAARGLTLEEIGEQVGKNKSTITKWMSPDRCPPEARSQFLAGRLSLGQCYQIATSPDPLETLAALLSGATVAEAGRRAGRKAAAGRPGGQEEKAPRLTIPLVPTDESGSLGTVTIAARAGESFDLAGAKRILQEALLLVKEAERRGLDVKNAQAGWRALASAKPPVAEVVL